jgi:DNA-binding MarR family transcriptional regulator
MASDRRNTQPGLRQTGVLAWLRLMRVFQKIDAASAHLFQHYPHKLSTAQFDVLAHIGAAEGCTQQSLAESLFVTKGNISQLIGRMERDGLVRREQDGRSNLLYLTPEGRALFDELVPRQEQMIAQLMTALSPTEQTQLLSLLRKLDQSID